MASPHPKELVLTQQEIDRFLSMMPSGESNECWEWPKRYGLRGYGYFGIGRARKTQRKAHRVAWHIFKGPIPEGLLVLHKCDNPPCVNYTRHLFLGTNKDNSDDMRSKGRHAHGESLSVIHRAHALRGDESTARRYPESRPRGSKQWNAKLKEAEIVEIRESFGSGETPLAIATKYGVTRETIYYIVKRLTWKHVP